MVINPSKNEKFLLVFVFVIFLVLRIPGLDLPYHQDEYKWAFLVDPASDSRGSVTDPPFSELLFIGTAKVFGYDHFRYMPFTFGLLALALLFYFVKLRLGIREALWSGLFFAIAYYNVWASLLVDRDGEVIPAIFLASLIFFYKWLSALSTKKKILWGLLLALSLAVGFLTRLSFILVIGTLFFEFVFYNWGRLKDGDFLFRYGSLFFGFISLLMLTLLNAHLIYPPFNIALLFNYSGHFVVSSGRNWLQIGIQFFKAILYLSPLLLASLFFIPKRYIEFLRVFFIFIIFGLIFYLGLFDFSSGALDRYFVFIIVPLSIITGTVTADILRAKTNYNLTHIYGVGFVLAGALFFLQFLSHYVPALYPKPEWFYRVFEFKWNFILPFFGGSGPLGFYVSWLFICFSWILTVILVIAAYFKKEWLKPVWIIILILGVQYNLIFVEEYLFGRINGNANILLRDIQEFVINNKEIKKVITYNDIGAYELRKTDKYQRRLYVAPKFEGSYQDVLNNFKSYYMVLEIPKIDPDSIYAKYFATCEIIYEEWSGVIPARVYDCRNAKNI